MLRRGLALRRLVILGAVTGTSLALAFPGLATAPGTTGRILFYTSYGMSSIDPRNGPGPGERFGFGDTAAWSPQGNAVAFTGKDAEGRRDIFVARGDGNDVVQITNTSADERRPTWSPDGRRIAFSSNADGDYDIYVMNADGTDVHNITNSFSITNDNEPVWSPDGSLIAFQTYRDGSWEVYTIHPDGTSPVDVSNSPYTDGPTDWSPDSSTILYESNRGSWDVYAVGRDGSNPQPLVTSTSSDGGAVFSPDGKAIAFDSNRTGRSQIYTARPDGSGATQLTNGDEDASMASWQPLQDQQPPTVHAYPVEVPVKGALTPRFSAKDTDARVGVQFRLPGVRGLASFAWISPRSVPTQGVVTVKIPLLIEYLRLSKAKLPAKPIYCVRVSDASYNLSAESCASLTIDKPPAAKKVKSETGRR